jgi:SecD/SecF fusion protein
MGTLLGVGGSLFAAAVARAWIPMLGQAAAAEAPRPWYAESWILWLVAGACVIGPSFLAWLVSGSLRARDMWGRLAVVLTALTCGAVIVASGWPPRLGIDLKGGVILVYEVDSAKRVTEQADDVARRMEEILNRETGLEGVASRSADGTVAVRLETADATAVERFIAAVEAAEFGDARVRLGSREETTGAVVLDYEVAGAAAPVDMDKLVAAVSRRVNPGGQKEVTVRQYGLDQLEVIVPDVDQAEVDLIKRIVSSAGVLEFRITANESDTRHRRLIELATRSPGNLVAEEGRPLGRWVELDTEKMDASEESGLVTRRTADGRTEVLVVVDRFNVTGGYLTRALSSYDQNLQPCVNFSFNSAGSSLFGTLTGQNLPDPANRLTSRLGIVLDDTLLSAPTIRTAISGDGQITGRFKQADVDFLVGVLNAGSLPAALSSDPVSEQKISPQLGADTIRSGSRAMLLALVVVLAFMLVYYRFMGLVADLAVLLNVLLVVAVMISLKAAFTLAGLAGLVLTVGMAVDANVLIYERMREELDRGASMRMAIRNGFQRAFSTIVDSNLTTLITGVVLYAIGTDQLKGFAVTLVLGLTLNLFTAVFCSRVIFDLAERNRWITNLSMMRLFGKTDISFVAWLRPAVTFALAFLAVGLAAAFWRGQGIFDIDFTGGTSVQLAFKPGEGLDVGEVRRAVATLPDVAVSSMTSTDSQASTRYKIDTSLKDADLVERTLQEAFPGRLATYSMGFGEISPIGLPQETPAGEDGGSEQPQSGQLVTTVSLDFPQRINRPALEEVLQRAAEAEGVADAAFQLDAGLAGSGSGSIRAKAYQAWALATSLDAEATRKVVERMATELSETPVYLSANRIGGKVAGNTKVTAVYALVASLVCIVLYVWLRFQNVAFGIAAVVALAFDVLVTVSCLALSTFVAPFLGWALVDDFKISLDVIAALLTIVGFSINDTIVIFDRLREIRGKSPFLTSEMVDRALNQTLSRTILTSGTSLLATLILYIFGGQGIHAFAFTMLVGIISGTFSTIYIASPLVLLFQGKGATGRVGLAAAGQAASLAGR